MPSRYAEAHLNATGAGDARPTALDIIKDEGLEGKLAGKVFFITGCASGIGIETARALSATGATLYLTARNIQKGGSALADVLEPGRVELLEMDQNSLDGVRSCVKEFLQKSNTPNCLINNAGIMATPERKTADGFESQFGVNHLSHFLLFQLLKPTLLASSTPEFHSRVVCVSSSGHRRGPPNFGDYAFEKVEYTPFGAYAQSKSANIYMANEIERRYGAKGLHGLNLHPGGIATGLQVHVPEETKKEWPKNPGTAKFSKSPAQGASTTVYAAVSKEWEGKGGRFLEDCTESPPAGGPSPSGAGYAPHAYNPEGRRDYGLIRWKWSGWKTVIEDEYEILGTFRRSDGCTKLPFLVEAIPKYIRAFKDRIETSFHWFYYSLPIRHQ